MHAGCYVGSTCINNLSYADDMVLLSLSVSALMQMLETCEEYAMAHGLEYNPKKSEVMVFKAGKIKPYYVPPIMLNRVPLMVTDKVKYLGHILTSDLNDDLDFEGSAGRWRLWVRYTRRAFNALRVLYNNAFRMLMGLPTWCSASGMLAVAHADSFQAIMCKKIVSLMSRVRLSTNSILNAIAG
ncbi:uncharacterized protein LOC113232344, partial [Hyposmocoma kahamanoa]|uniref:uncharacterized protein LOC113232344 n=1 Tax=Hyposmocoma kahamanoa TaxID=1477025 RepID=UPI000E6D71F0